MPDSDQNKPLRHLFIRNAAVAEDYTSPNQAPRPRFPQRTRNEHANHLLGQLRTIELQSEEKRAGIPVGAPAPDGIYLQFESSPGFDLTTKSLDLSSRGIELLSVKQEGQETEQRILATVFVPDDEVSFFIKRIEQYRDEETQSGKPKNRALVDSISNIRLAVVQSLWTDLADVFPQHGEKIWWEVWLRATSDAVPRFQNFAQARDIAVSSRVLIFEDRHVILAYTDAEMLSASIESLGFIAELRRAKETVADFLEMTRVEQKAWADALVGLVDPPPANGPAVCILDTGVNRAHPLIAPFSPVGNYHTCQPDWGADDHDGHGTGMAGLALYGCLEDALVSTSRIAIPAEIESVKILPPLGQNNPDLYGSITEEAVSRATVAAPKKERIVCMAITSTDDRDRGQPSSWSAAVDKICAGDTVEGKRHLFFVSAGNVSGDHIAYPEINLTESIHDPGQAWNAVTVGSYTEKATITEPSFAGWTPLAPVGDIAPATTSSLIWQRNKWPLKPEIVFEGGNAAVDPSGENVDHPDSLGLLTTHNEVTRSLFTWFSDTSASTAIAANMAAKIGARYPEYWPETIRALMVHSAEWTPRMKGAYPTASKGDRENLLRMCGYGVPNLQKAVWCAKNHLTLVCQESLRPFDRNSMKEMHVHNLPWPVDVLRELGETNVRMRVTLSYFIEPNPARRGWEHKFRYQSHGLRFSVKTSLESNEEFITRINRDRWIEETRGANVTSVADEQEWYFGRQIRSKGCVHSDFWEGSAVSLAEKAQIAVFPVVGWWREKHSEGHTEKDARYCLLVSIEAPGVNTDIYTPVENLIITPIRT